MRYDAFISYRHLPLDKAVAKRLQTLLERTRPPRGLVCRNTQRISRIFRDESELPTSGDLGKDIISALEESSYLVVLCSPKLKESKWCMQEIMHFKRLHGWRINRILPVLVDGDPDEAFPDILRYEDRIFTDEYGNESIERVEIEPLACNITSDGDIKKSLKSLKIEYLRIAAPILGCGFDDLYRRHRRRKIRRIITTASASVFLAAVFSTALTLQNRNVIAHRDSMYVELSVSAYQAGHISRAVDYAMRALAPRGLFMPDFLPHAQLALTSALGVYDLVDGYRPAETITLPGRTISFALSGDGRTAAVISPFEVIVLDIEEAREMNSFFTARSALAEAAFLNDSILLFAGEDGLTAYDINGSRILWTGEMATGVAVSADNSTIAAIYLDESRALIYNPDGTVRKIIDFEGRRQRVVYHDVFANPATNLFELSNDGNWLAVSFYDDEPLTLFNVGNPDMVLEIPGTEEYLAFTGGFYGDYFAFSAARAGFVSVAMIVDIVNLESVFFQESDRNFRVLADEHGIFISNENLNGEAIILQIDTVSDEHQLVGYADAEIINFAINPYGLIISTADNIIKLFDRNGSRLGMYNLGHLSNFVAINGNHAIIAAMDSTELLIFERRDNTDFFVFSYDQYFQHEQTRINGPRTRVMRFSPWSFRLYNINGDLINEAELPDPMRMHNQQFSEVSGNLAVIHKDEALRIYSGDDGSLLFERVDLVSTFFAPYGISILERDGTLSLIDLDTAEAVQVFQMFLRNGGFAAYAGMIVDSEFLGRRDLIGAARHGDGYLFAVSNWEGNIGAVYDHNGDRLFEVEAGEISEAHFTDEAVVIAPLHGMPMVYNLSSGSRIRELEEEAYLTYVHQFGRYIVVEYITALGERFGSLKNPEFEAIAHLPSLTDLSEGRFVFDHGQGNVLERRVYSLDELKELALAIIN